MSTLAIADSRAVDALRSAISACAGAASNTSHLAIANSALAIRSGAYEDLSGGRCVNQMVACLV